MADYDFRSLSSWDFALLCRDLLQAEFGIRLESFSAGPDCGIDFRHSSMDGNEELIVQCKHYAESGFSALTSVLRRKEYSKIKRLSPSRYALATSVPLTPDRKEVTRDILGVYCRQLSDIFGREDLNNLLGRHSEVERKHFKLWLTSEPVLKRVLNAGIFSDSEAHLDRIRIRLCRYVQNPSFQRARELLSKYHYCIIAGIPGIGKTTLAEVLLADLVDRQGFESFRIFHGIDEIRPVKNSKRKQAFYFDDFLGKTALDKLDKNEDQRLVEFLEEVAANDNWRFILTTREYILNRAKLTYEAFAHPPVDFTLCVINLADYTYRIRARILYNHIYFSDLPKAHKLALLSGKAYEGILVHRNYSPRVIEYMTQERYAGKVPAARYPAEFVNMLEHPARIWEHAFRHQISEAARHLLLVVATLPDEMLLNDVETAFWSFYRFRQVRFGFATKSGDWNEALRELDGNFLAIKKVGSDITVSFHNPSVRDFMEDMLCNSDQDVMDLVAGAGFYEQYVTLWKGKRGHPYSGIKRNRRKFLNELRAKLFGANCGTIRVVDSDGEQIGLSHARVSNESRAAFAVALADEMGDADGEAFLKDVIDALQGLWVKGNADREDLAKLLRSLTKRGLTPEDSTFIAAKNCLSTDIEELNHFRAVADFIDNYPGELSPNEIAEIQVEFLKLAEKRSDEWDDDPDWLRQIAADIEFVGDRIGVDVAQFTARLYERADEAEVEHPEREGEADDDGWEPDPPGDGVEAMFEDLRTQLEE